MRCPELRGGRLHSVTMEAVSLACGKEAEPLDFKKPAPARTSGQPREGGC